MLSLFFVSLSELYLYVPQVASWWKLQLAWAQLESFGILPTLKVMGGGAFLVSANFSAMTSICCKI